MNSVQIGIIRYIASHKMPRLNQEQSKSLAQNLLTAYKLYHKDNGEVLNYSKYFSSSNENNEFYEQLELDFKAVLGSSGVRKSGFFRKIFDPKKEKNFSNSSLNIVASFCQEIDKQKELEELDASELNIGDKDLDVSLIAEEATTSDSERESYFFSTKKGVKFLQIIGIVILVSACVIAFVITHNKRYAPSEDKSIEERPLAIDLPKIGVLPFYQMGLNHSILKDAGLIIADRLGFLNSRDSLSLDIHYEHRCDLRKVGDTTYVNRLRDSLGYDMLIYGFVQLEQNGEKENYSINYSSKFDVINPLIECDFKIHLSPSNFSRLSKGHLQDNIDYMLYVNAASSNLSSRPKLAYSQLSNVLDSMHVNTELTYYLRSVASTNLDSFSKALDDLNYIIDNKLYHQNNKLNYLKLIARCHTRLQQFKKAENLYLDILKKNPSDYKVLFNIGNLSHYYFKDYKHALYCYDRALRYAPNGTGEYKLINIRRCEALYLLKRFNESLKLSKKLIALNNYSTNRLYLIKGMSELYLDNYTQASVDLENAIEKDSTNLAISFTTAMSYFLADSLDKTIPHLDRCILMVEGKTLNYTKIDFISNVYALKALVLKRMGRHALYKSNLNQALLMNAESPFASSIECIYNDTLSFEEKIVRYKWIYNNNKLGLGCTNFYGLEFGKAMEFENSKLVVKQILLEPDFCFPNYMNIIRQEDDFIM